ncbi:PREDICTED: anther-specific proline-rich protein APG-like [Vollenhovia emeryi]|uniref:anther-specific proline-rich protein APG-like n=1 Tax=Vollenhovia emeryi TaxID=411798 RepID=UPI0005F4633D|nr:PREDICTED: anther-specific proline-rich protein APG-like [Vollenhovia emeryi]
MGRSRRAGRLVQLRRLTRAYATPGVFDPRIFDRPLEPPEPRIQDPSQQPPVPCRTHPLPSPESLPPHQLIPPSPPLSMKSPLAPGHPHLLPLRQAPDPCPIRAWAPRPPITPAPRPPKASVVRAPPALPAERTKRPGPEPQALRGTLAQRTVRPCTVRIEALPQKVRLVKRPRNQPRESKDMPTLL